MSSASTSAARNTAGRRPAGQRQDRRRRPSTGQRDNRGHVARCSRAARSTPPSAATASRRSGRRGLLGAALQANGRLVVAGGIEATCWSPGWRGLGGGGGGPRRPPAANRWPGRRPGGGRRPGRQAGGQPSVPRCNGSAPRSSAADRRAAQGHPPRQRDRRPRRQRQDRRRPRQRHDLRRHRQRQHRRGTGNDRLYGQNGKDKLGGGSGKDSLNGGTGKDHPPAAAAKTTSSEAPAATTKRRPRPRQTTAVQVNGKRSTLATPATGSGALPARARARHHRGHRRARRPDRSLDGDRIRTIDYLGGDIVADVRDGRRQARDRRLRDRPENVVVSRLDPDGSSDPSGDTPALRSLNQR